MTDPLGLTFKDGLRRATLDDLPRVALVAAAGFFWSPVFHFQRPYHDRYPEDTLASYLAEYKADLTSPDRLVLVSVDDWISNEAEQIYDALRPFSVARPHSAPDNQVITGICSLALGDLRVLNLVDTNHIDVRYDNQPRNHALRRDRYLPAAVLYSNSTKPTKEKYLAGRMQISTLAVHPAYWGRGHASKLIDWCTDLANRHNLALGVSAAKLGVKHFSKAGFVEQDRVKVPGYRLPHSSPAPEISDQANTDGNWIESIEIWIGIRPPQPPSQTAPVSL